MDKSICLLWFDNLKRENVAYEQQQYKLKSQLGLSACKIQYVQIGGDFGKGLMRGYWLVNRVDEGCTFIYLFKENCWGCS